MELLAVKMATLYMTMEELETMIQRFKKGPFHSTFIIIIPSMVPSNILQTNIFPSY